ncbi:hypothetical protein GCM10020219_043980 [Nonomuraea dietziae]
MLPGRLPVSGTLGTTLGASKSWAAAGPATSAGSASTSAANARLPHGVLPARLALARPAALLSCLLMVAMSATLLVLSPALAPKAGETSVLRPRAPGTSTDLGLSSPTGVYRDLTHSSLR